MDIAFFVHDTPTWITDQIVTLKNKGLDVRVFSFTENSIYSNDQRVNKIQPVIINLGEKRYLRIIQSFINSPVMFIKLLIVFFSIHSKYGYSLKTLVKMFPALLNTTDLLISDPPKFIHANFASLPGFFTSIVSFLIKKPFTVTVHASGDIYRPNPVLEYVLNSALSISSVNYFNIKYLNSEKKIELNKMFVSYLGVNPPAKIKYRIKNTLNSQTTIGLLAFFGETKGIPDLINAIQILKLRRYNVRLLIGGEGPQGEKYANQIKDMDLDKKIKFEGLITTENRDNFFEKLDIFCLPCVQDNIGGREGIPVVLMEAMAFGIPIISTKHSGIPELVIDRETGLLVDEHAPDQIADAITELVHDKNLLSFLSGNGFNHIKKNFDIKKNTLEHARRLGWIKD
jgi:colanic acid/amylovoran biosynthesis glycosyltransferase